MPLFLSTSQRHALADTFTPGIVMHGNFTLSEWIIVGTYLLAVCTIGSLFYRRRSSASDYFLGGRSMRVIPVAISLVAADLSGMTVMGAPAWGFEHNLELF